MNRIKSLVLGGAVALSSLAAPLSSNVAKPSLTATAAGSDDYAKLLQYSLYLYDANMCGSDVGEKSGLSWRDDCHTSDEVQGGYHDAGDHAMFGLPQGYTASSLGWSYYEFKDAYNETGQAEHIKLILDRFCEFFKDSTKLSGNSVSSFLYQKGDGDADHKYWGPPENQGGSRKMFWTSSGASDIAADYAAALALNYINFGNAEDLKYAEALYNFSTQHNAVATDGPNNFYKSSGCQDEQANAAGWLYIATNNEKYKNDCASKQVQYIGWVDGWDNRGLGAACVYAHITGDWGKVNNYISGQASGSNYLFMDKWGSARLNTTMQFCALVASKNSNRDFKSWAKGQMDYITGNNPANTCFVVGFASNSAKNAHHRAASGYTSYEQFDMNNWDPNGNHMQPFSQYGPNSHLLVGALVGGPCDASGTYHDNMGDFICNEVAIDYNAGFVGAAAGLYHFYKTGKTVSSIEGVDKIYSGSVTPGPGVTTTTSKNNPSVITTTTANPSTGGDTVLLPSDMVVDTELGDDGEINNYAEFAPGDAKTATLYYTVNSTDTESSGAFGTWTGKWEQEDFKVNVKNGKVEVTYEIPSNVGSTVKAMVFWPHGNAVTIDKVVLSSGSTPSKTTTTNRTTTTRRTTTTTAKTPSSGGNDVVLTPSDMVVDIEEGDDGEMNNYAEFAHDGAKSCTLYYTVNTNDTESSGGFGTWNGEWVQEEFKVNVKNGKVEVSYDIPADAGSTIKAMIWWPHDKGVTIDKVVLHFDESKTTTTTKRTTTTTRTTTTRTTTSRTTTTRTTTTTTQTPGTPTVRPTIYGDASDNGKVLLNDAVLVLQYLGNPDQYKLSAQGLANADVCNPGDGVTNKDALSIQRYILKIVSSLPEYQ
ncbi:MAG: glycoside hydrolase family 9 protein [Ruminococcus sp.]|nr:glycoside hydrolase family 9 protein [Ruminococcus sp.]